MSNDIVASNGRAPSVVGIKQLQNQIAQTQGDKTAY